MRDLKFIVEIYKVGLLRDTKVDDNVVAIQGLIYPNQIIKNESANSLCLSQKPTKYYGVAYAIATIDGELRRTLKVLSARTMTLNCGS